MFLGYKSLANLMLVLAVIALLFALSADQAWWQRILALVGFAGFLYYGFMYRAHGAEKKPPLVLFLGWLFVFLMSVASVYVLYYPYFSQ